jgi:hypothetical protein
MVLIGQLTSYIKISKDLLGKTTESQAGKGDIDRVPVASTTNSNLIGYDEASLSTFWLCTLWGLNVPCSLCLRFPFMEGVEKRLTYKLFRIY